MESFIDQKGIKKERRESFVEMIAQKITYGIRSIKVEA